MLPLYYHVLWVTCNESRESGYLIVARVEISLGARPRLICVLRSSNATIQYNQFIIKAYCIALFPPMRGYLLTDGSAASLIHHFLSGMRMYIVRTIFSASDPRILLATGKYLTKFWHRLAEGVGQSPNFTLALP